MRPFDPAPLRRVGASTARMEEEVTRGADPTRVLAAEAGLDTLSAGERSLVAAALGDSGALGLALGELESRRAGVGWTTTGHTAADVGLFAWGPGAERFRGVLENREVGRRIAALLGVPVGVTPPAFAAPAAPAGAR